MQVKFVIVSYCNQILCPAFKTIEFYALNIVSNYQSFIYSPTNALVCCLKNNIKIYIKTTPTYFGAVTPSSGSALILAY